MAQSLRAAWHDYTAPCIYMVTLRKAAGVPPLGRVIGDWRLEPRTRGAAFLQPSPTGALVKVALQSFFGNSDSLRLLQYALMPDHLHMLIEVSDWLQEEMGRYLARFKSMLRHDGNPVFAPGFNDQILRRGRSLEQLYRYLASNARRLAVRQAVPEFFSRAVTCETGGERLQAYGNLHLLENCFCRQIVVHRSDSAESYGRMKEEWVRTAANGGVAVSPFVALREKEVLRAVLEAGGRVIYLTTRPLGDREKPAGRAFELCTQGRLLRLAPLVALESGRAAFMHLNRLAAAIAARSGG